MEHSALPGWFGAEVVSGDGEALGTVTDLLFDVHTHAPGWLAVRRPAGPTVLVPGRRLRHHLGCVVVAASGALVRSAPAAQGPPGELQPTQALDLAAHYGVRCAGGPWRGLLEPVPTRPVALPRLR